MKYTAATLRELDPREFERQYHKWLEFAPDYEWWDPIYDDFRARMASDHDTTVADIQFRGFWSQGDGCGWSGRVALAPWMRNNGYAHLLPLVLALEADGAYARVNMGWRYPHCRNVDLPDPPMTDPQGVWSDLAPEAWEDLIDEQWQSVAQELERSVLEWARECADSLYRELEREFEDLTSEEEFIAACDANEIAFEGVTP